MASIPQTTEAMISSRRGGQEETAAGADLREPMAAAADGRRRNNDGGTCTGTIAIASTGSSSSSSRIASLALPWASLVLTAVVASAVVLLGQSQSQQQANNNNEDHEMMFWQQQQPRENDRSLQEHHAHHPVYSEEHEPLFPLTSSDYWGFAMATLGLMLAAGGGIGGGGILVPVYILIMGFSPKHAIPLSNITVFGGAVANTMLNVVKRHPLADRPLVDWDLILVMEPLTIGGALIGAFLNKILPELLLTVLLVLLLSFTSYNSLTKAVKMYRKETQQLRQAGLREDGTKESELTMVVLDQEEEDVDEAAEGLLDNAEKQDGTDEDKGEEEDGDGEEGEEGPAKDGGNRKKKLQDRQLQKELDDILEQERYTPQINLTILGALFVVVLVINLLKGGGAFRSPIGIVCGSASFWAANATMILWILIITVFVRQYLVRKHESKLRCRFDFVEGDIRWDARATVVYPVVCCAAGFFAGMFGVGGGIVKGPLMLAMGVHPAVSSASSACMILFTSFTATTSYIVFGLLVPDYAVVCGILGFVATVAGQLGLGYLMKKAKAQRNSYIAFSIGFVVLLSAFLMTVQSLLSMAAGEHHHSGGICGKGD